MIFIDDTCLWLYLDYGMASKKYLVTRLRSVPHTHAHPHVTWLLGNLCSSLPTLRLSKLEVLELRENMLQTLPRWVVVQCNWCVTVQCMSVHPHMLPHSVLWLCSLYVRMYTCLSTPQLNVSPHTAGETGHWKQWVCSPGELDLSIRWMITLIRSVHAVWDYSHKSHTYLIILFPHFLSLQPTVVGSLESLCELWLDVNTINSIPEVGTHMHIRHTHTHTQFMSHTHTHTYTTHTPILAHINNKNLSRHKHHIINCSNNSCTYEQLQSINLSLTMRGDQNGKVWFRRESNL